MANLLQPFDFLRLRHPELRRYQVFAMLAGFAWLLFECGLCWLTGSVVTFFGAGGVLGSLATALSVLVGVYFGLAGVVLATSSPWLSAPMPSSPWWPEDDPAVAPPLPRRVFFSCLLIYCAAASTVIVFGAAVGAPPAVALGTALLTPTQSSVASTVCSAIVIVACTHVLLASFLGLRFLSKSAQA